MTATAMTFYVKSETVDWIAQSYPCFEPRQVFENLEDQRKMGREARVEDAGEKVLDEMTQRWGRAPMGFGHSAWNCDSTIRHRLFLP
jgi:hypothetical protein